MAIKPAARPVLCKIDLGYSSQIVATPAIASKIAELLAQCEIITVEWTGNHSVLQTRETPIEIQMGRFEILSKEQVASIIAAEKAEREAEQA